MTSNPSEHDNLLMTVIEVLSGQGSEGMKTLLETVLNAAMRLERDQALNAAPYERSDERQGYANGFKPKMLQSRMGELELKVPQARGIAFYPGCLEKGLRSEKALKLAIAEMYLKGVSTRKVEAITKELCGMDISSTQVSRMTKELDQEFNSFRNRPLGHFKYLFLDALYLKVRHEGTVIDQAILIAYGINSFGRREIVGSSAELSEAEVHWRSFLESLQQRGLSGLELITSDSHSGLKAALRSVFPSVLWQRCQFHMSQNAQQYAPRKHLREDIGTAMRDIFNSPTLTAAQQMVKEVSDRFAKSAPQFVKWLDTNIDEGLTCYQFPRKHRRRIRTSNGVERINREVRRRSRVAVLFPNSASALRLVSAVLMEIHEEWVSGKTYLDMSLDGQETFQQELGAAM